MQGAGGGGPNWTRFPGVTSPVLSREPTASLAPLALAGVAQAAFASFGKRAATAMQYPARQRSCLPAESPAVSRQALSSGELPFFLICFTGMCPESLRRTDKTDRVRNAPTEPEQQTREAAQKQTLSPLGGDGTPNHLAFCITIKCRPRAPGWCGAAFCKHP